MNIDSLVDRVEDMPEDPEAIKQLIADIREAWQALQEEVGDDAPTQEQLDLAERLTALVEEARAAYTRAVKARREEEGEAAARAEKMSGMSEAFAEDDAVEDAGAPEGDNEGGAEEGTVFAAEDETSEPEGEAGAEGAGGADGDKENTGAGESAAEDGGGAQAANDDNDKEQNMADTKFAGRAASSRSEEFSAPAESPFKLDRAAANYQPGGVDVMALAEAFEDVSSGRAVRATGNGVTTTAKFAYLDRSVDPQLVATDEQSLVAAVEHAVDESRLEGGSLVAAGGWCAPSETTYEFLPTLQADNLLSLPEVAISRGGLRFPVEPDFSALYEAGRYQMTEAEAISGTTKECVEIPCPDMEELRLDVMWTCVTGNLLQNKGWPELTSKFIAEAMKAHAHRLSAARLAAVLDASDQAAVGVPEIGAVGTILNAIELHAEDLRIKYRLGRQTVEGIAPVWLRTVLRADLAYRDEVLPQQVTDAMLDQHLADRGVRLQFVADYQTDVIGAGPGSLAYPDNVKVVLYPAGTFISSVQQVANLGAIYDSTGLSKNQRTELFIEDGFGVGKRGYESREITIPLDVNGVVGARNGGGEPGTGGGEPGPAA